jgi:cellulose biosynthesis protein BcsQ
MRTIAFVTQKGGSGKSTIASSLAVAAHEMKEKVCVIDMDPQGSLANWAKTRGSGDIEVIASGAARLPALLSSLERRGFTLAILDTPGAEGAASSAAMQVADLNIIPSRPSMFDLWASARTRAALKEIGGDFVFLLNQCPPAQQTARVQDGVPMAQRPRKCAAFGNRSNAAWRAPRSGSPPARRRRFEASRDRLAERKARAAILPPLAQIGRTLPGALPFFVSRRAGCGSSAHRA